METVLSSDINFSSSLTDRIIYFIQEYLFTNLQWTKSYQYLFFATETEKKLATRHRRAAPKGISSSLAKIAR